MNYEPRIDHAAQRAHRNHGLKGKQKAIENGILDKPVVFLKKGQSFENYKHKGPPDRKIKITEKDMAEIRKLYAEGMTMSEIGKKYRVSGTTISNRLKICK